MPLHNESHNPDWQPVGHTIYSYDNCTLSHLFEQHPDYVCELDTSGYITAQSNDLSLLLGYPKEETTGTLLDFVAEKDRKRSYRRFTKCLSGIPQRFHVAAVQKNKVFLDIDITLIPIIQNNEVVQVLGIFKDVSKKTPTEKIHRNSAPAQHPGEVGSWDYDLLRKEAYWSDQVYSILEVNPPKDLPPSHSEFTAFIHSSDQERVRNIYHQALTGKKGYAMEYRIHCQDGQERTIFEQADVILDKNKKPVRLIGTVRDITEQTQANHKRKEDRNQLITTMNRINAGIWSMDFLEKMISSASEGINKNDGYSADIHTEWENIVYPAGAAKNKAVRKAGTSGAASRQYYRMMHQNGEVKWVRAQKIPLMDEKRQLVQIDAIVSEVTDHKEKEERMQYYAYHDYLTGLPNRRQLEEELHHLINKTNQDFAVMYLDIDRFKHVNDALGYVTGDELLKQVSQRLTACLSRQETAARMSGNEFLILIPHASQEDKLHELADTLLRKMEKPFSVNGYELYITTSIGISLYPADGQTAEELIKNADTALARAKAFGRNNYQLYKPTMSSAPSKSLLLEQELRTALADNDLYLHFQPRVDANTGHMVGAEALIRWDHPQWGMVPPDEFIPLAEKSELIIEVGDWVLKTVCWQIKAWQEKELPVVPVSINITARGFINPDWVKTVLRTLEHTRVDPSLIELEVTETSLLQYETAGLNALTSLKEAGIKLAMDDFGTGFSSITYLRQFRFDTIKIDHSFIWNMLQNKEDAAITSSIIQLAHGLNMKIVAEGVETTDQLDFLREKGCDEIQGYLYSKPVSPGKLEDMLTNQPFHPATSGAKAVIPKRQP